MNKTMSWETLKGLEEIGIVEFVGAGSSIATDAQTAQDNWDLVQVRAMSGNVYDLANGDGATVKLIARGSVYSAADAS